jgi:hypothetical protein
MATNQNGLLHDRLRAGARRAALAALGIALAACAASPTEPRSAGLDKWDGEPVVTTTNNCIPAGCATRAPGPATP